MAAVSAGVGTDRISCDGMKRPNVFHLSSLDPDVPAAVDWELEHHIAERADQLMALGMARDAALEEARRALGDLDRVRAELMMIDADVERRRRVGDLMETVLQDVRLAWRNVRGGRITSIAIVLTLALGMGANTALFSVIDALLLRPLPYASPAELVAVQVGQRDEDWGQPYISLDMSARLREAPGLFAGSFMHTRTSGLLRGEEPQTISVQAVSHEFEEVLGVQPLFGRGFIEADNAPGATRVALLSHTLWQAEFGGDRAVLGRELTINDATFEIVGVMPPGFKFPEYSTTAAWIVLRADGTALTSTPAARVGLVGRVPETRHAQAATQAASVGGAVLREQDPQTQRVVRLSPLEADRARNADLRRGVWLAAGATLLILLVAGVNMLNLLLVRTSARTQEIAVRIALGASRTRLVRQLALEAMLLAVLGGIGAVAFAFLALRFVHGVIPDSIVFFAPHAIEIEQRTLLFAFTVAVLTGLVFGLVPAVRATWWADPAARGALTRYAGRTHTARRLRAVLVGAEVALSVVLLVAAGLLVNSFVRLMRVDPGLELDRLAVVVFTTTRAGRPDGPLGPYLQRLEERIEAVPGVEAATLSGGMPPHTSFSFGLQLEAEGRNAAGGDAGLLPFIEVRPDFFEVTGARLLLGRTFDNRDTNRENVIVDEDLAHHLWREESPIGRRFRLSAQDPWLTVIGVMRDMKLMGPDDREGDFEILYPAVDYGELAGQLTLAVRTNRDPEELLPALRQAVRSYNPNQALTELTTAKRYYADAVEMPKFLVVLIATLAAVALVLAAVGQYGLLAHGVQQRRPELALRIALGAQRGHLRRLVLREALILVTMGSVAGVAGALLAGRIIENALFGVQARDPATLALVLATIFAAAAIATALPAWRATRVSPLEAMRAL